ncbi:ubiquinone/menaquinone biosynthesis C-methylase UbiE [Nocardia tenerifensis]|uniref:Ubiquinone/menaquinone biosynthesis C-methylase UbiE n=1 Tax=Nocardia tenerifensis TaxID=228006 RepID=A0A318KC06_9NOCA|nr:class I SAM-dependent methyltransferase [Nocardia tenerifensis]PXX63011.1 ubiquinone/menaquinone biosynthesis C-methylase UbiE [Nocardia tenerifensis]
MSGNPLACAEPWDLVADGYAEFAPAIMQPFSDRALEFASLTPASEIVDVAAGSGLLSLLAAPHVARVHAIDFSAPMIERLATAAAAEGLTNIEAGVGDGQALPFDSDRFDAGFSMFGLMFFPERGKGFAELFRVLRPGGTAVVSSWAPVVEAPLMRMMFGALRAADPSIQEPQPNYLSLENPEVFQTEMRRAGFEAVSIQRHSTSIAFADADELWETMARSSAPLSLTRRSIGEQAWADRVAVMKAYLIEHYRPRQPLSTTAFLGIGHKPAP